MIEVQILIPTTSNAGEALTDAHHKDFEDGLVVLFGGVSRLSAEVVGLWLDAGSVYRDKTRCYMVAVGGLIADAAAVREMVDFAKSHYDQLKVYVRYLGQSEIL